MRIQSNYTYKPNFGYDKKLNSELKQSLSTYPDKRWAQTLSSMNTYCNRLESNIVNEAKNSNKEDSKFQDYLDIFLSCKQILAGFISITFEDLGYADREFKHYQDEFIKNGSKDDDWHKDACDILSDWVSPNISNATNSTKTSPQTQEPSTKNTSDIDEVQEKSNIDNNTDSSSDISDTTSVSDLILSNLSKKSFLEEFKPDSHSPKGFIDVSGMDDLKRDLSEGIIELIKNPEQAKLDFEEYGKSIPNTILLYGPTKRRKTYITQALASEIDSPMFMLNISKAGSHYINLTSKNLKAAFDEAINIAKMSDKPCLLFMDEIDSLCFDRNSRMEPDDLKQVATMLQSIDDAKNSDVIIIGATNKFNLLDPAIRRRFDTKVFVDVPDFDSRKALVIKNLSAMKKGVKLLNSPDDIELIAKKLEGYSNSSICIISKQAALNAMRRNRADISVDDYANAIESTSEEKPDINIYKSDSLKSNKKIGFSS